jgi:hypothetical protein
MVNSLPGTAGFVTQTTVVCAFVIGGWETNRSRETSTRENFYDTRAARRIEGVRLALHPPGRFPKRNGLFFIFTWRIARTA